MGLTLDHVAGVTYHGRRGAVGNAFRYRVDYIVTEPEAEGRLPALFSRNRFNLTSLNDRDHGGERGNGRGAGWVREVLAEQGLTDLARDARILLMAQPRVLGHVFNPVSFWLIEDGEGVLRAVIAEVNNTFGDRHSYLCHHGNLAPITGEGRLAAQKVFHVSPFQPVAGDYAFRFDIRAERVNIRIDYGTEDGGLYATLTGTRRPLTSRAILRAALARPFGSRRVLALIHWQALKLWWKGATFRSRPEAPTEEVSR